MIRNASDGKKYLYDIVSIKKDTTISGWLTNKAASAAANTAGQKGSAISGRISQARPDVKRQSRAAQDSEGNSLTHEQKAYIADSRVRDKDGRLQIMYRGGKLSRIIQFAPDIKNFYFLDRRNRSGEYEKFM